MHKCNIIPWVFSRISETLKRVLKKKGTKWQMHTEVVRDNMMPTTFKPLNALSNLGLRRLLIIIS